MTPPPPPIDDYDVDYGNDFQDDEGDAGLLEDDYYGNEQAVELEDEEDGVVSDDARQEIEKERNLHDDEDEQEGQEDNFDGDFEMLPDEETRRDAAGFDATTAAAAANKRDFSVIQDGTVPVLSKDVSSTGRPKCTTRYLTKYERARLLGTRALQLSMNAPPLVEIRPGETDALQIAQRELRERKLPLMVRRYLPDGSYEDWGLDELIID